MITVEWIIGAGLMFGLALILNYYTFESLKGFFVFLTIFNAFVIWAGLLPFWTLILNLIILTYLMYIELKIER